MEEKNVLEETVAEQQPVEEVKLVVNCPKCAAALRVREGGIAYVCPVCNTIFRVRKATRMVNDEEKTAKNGAETITQEQAE